MAAQSYSKAPIVEALIDLRYSRLLDGEELRRAADAIGKSYALKIPGDSGEYRRIKTIILL